MKRIFKSTLSFFRLFKDSLSTVKFLIVLLGSLKVDSMSWGGFLVAISLVRFLNNSSDVRFVDTTIESI